MRIIKPGKEKVIERILTCKKCGCEFAYTKADTQYDQRAPLPYVSCPCCHDYIEVEVWRDYD